MSANAIRVSAMLFDLDGVLVDSVNIAEEAWTTWANRHRLDGAAVLHGVHGQRTVDTIRAWLPDADVQIEEAWLIAYEMDRLDACRPQPGAIPLLASLPSDRWAVVTSAPRALAEARLTTLAPFHPAILISSSDVTRGKPAPDPYLRAAELLGVASSAWLGIEDSNVGLRSIRSAGGIACGLTSTYPSECLQDAEIVLSNLGQIAVKASEKVEYLEVLLSGSGLMPI